jgi:hypothetical protein
MAGCPLTLYPMYTIPHYHVYMYATPSCMYMPHAHDSHLGQVGMTVRDALLAVHGGDHRRALLLQAHDARAVMVMMMVVVMMMIMMMMMMMMMMIMMMVMVMMMMLMLMLLDDDDDDDDDDDGLASRRFLISAILVK